MTRTIPAVLMCAAVLVAADQPRVSPPFAIQMVGAPAVQLQQYRGKIVLLAFIHTTCPHCQALTNVLNPIARDYTRKNVQFVECAFNDFAQMLVPKFIQQFQPLFPVGYSTSEAVKNYLGIAIMDQRPFYVPHLVFLDSRGMIRGDYPGESSFFQNPDVNIRAQLDRLLKTDHLATAANKKK